MSDKKGATPMNATQPTRDDLVKSLREKLDEKRGRRIGAVDKQRSQYVKQNGGIKNAKKTALLEAEKQVDLMFQQFGMNPTSPQHAQMRSRLLSAIKNNDMKTMESIIQTMQNEMGVSSSFEPTIDPQSQTRRNENLSQFQPENINLDSESDTGHVRIRNRGV